MDNEIRVRVSTKLKKELEIIAKGKGLNLSAFIRMHLTEVVESK